MIICMSDDDHLCSGSKEKQFERVWTSFFSFLMFDDCSGLKKKRTADIYHAMYVDNQSAQDEYLVYNLWIT